MLHISSLTLNLPLNEQRKSQINCPLCFLPLSRSSFIRPWESTITAEDNHADYEFILERATVWYSIMNGVGLC